MSGVKRYAQAVAWVVATTVVGIAVERWVRLGRIQAFLYVPGVLMVSAAAGRGPGLLVILLSPLAAEVTVPHAHTTDSLPLELLGLALFGAMGLGVSVVVGRLASARTEAVAAAAESHRQSDALIAAREDVARLARAVDQRSRDFMTLFEEAPIGMAFSEDAECKHITPNRAFAEMLGVVTGGNISQTAGAEDRIPLNITTPDGTRVLEHDLPMQRAARTGQPVRGVDVDIHRADGKRVSLVEFATPLFDDRETRGGPSAPSWT